MQKISLSALMDGEELNDRFIQDLCEDESLRATWQDFHLIRDVLRQETPVLLGEDFTRAVAKVIEQENISHLEEQPKPHTLVASLWQKFQPALMPIMQMGIAAGVCLVVVFGTQQFTASSEEGNDMPVLQTLPFNHQVQDVSYTPNTPFLVTTQQVQKKNKRLGEMIENYELQRRVYADKQHLQP